MMPDYFGGCVEPSKTSWGPLRFCMGSLSVWRFFRRDSQHYRRSKAHNGESHVNHRALWHPRKGTPRPPQNLHPCRGFALVGRWGPQTVRSGRKGHGKIRYFWNEGRVFLGREACLARGRVDTIEEVGCRAADRVVIYVIFAS